MYQVFSDDVFVLEVRPEGEHDAVLVVFAKSYGKLYIKAKGFLKNTSKHRMLLQPLVLAHIDMVAGYAGFRLTGAKQLKSWWGSSDPNIIKTWGRVLRVVTDLTPVEQPEGELFASLLEMFEANYANFFKDSQYRYLEAFWLARFLQVLGWWSNDWPSWSDLKTGQKAKDFIKFVNLALETAYS